MNNNWNNYYQQKREEKERREKWEYEFYRKVCEGMSEEGIRQVLYWRMMMDVVMMPAKESDGDPMVMGAMIGSESYQRLLKAADKHARQATGYEGKGTCKK